METVEEKTDHQDDRALFNALIDEIVALRAALTAITAKLDDDATVTGTDYAETCDPPAIGIQKVAA